MGSRSQFSRLQTLDPLLDRLRHPPTYLLEATRSEYRVIGNAPIALADPAVAAA
jgi:hypothetical protein